MFKLVLYGNPQAKQRHRSYVKGRKISTYDPQSKEKLQAKWICADQMRKNGAKSIKDGPIKVELTNFMPIPRSLNIGREKGLELAFHSKRPDLDNLEKFVFDVLNGIAWKDDGQVAYIISKKVYSSNPRVEIEIESIK